MVDSDDSDSSMRWMLLKILIERHGFLDHLLMQLRGVEQMKSVLLPHGKAEVGNVETGLIAGDGNDIAIVYGLTHGLGVFHLRFGDETELQTRDALFHLLNFRHILRMRLKGLVALGVPTHIIDFDGLLGCKGRIGLLDLTDDAGLLIRYDPIGEIMDARGIAIDDAIAITHIPKGILIGSKGELLAISTQCESGDGLNERRAIELFDIDD